MTLPRFARGADPGPDFAALVRGTAPELDPSVDLSGMVPHGTTCVAVKFADGVVMGGDRRATSGHLISHRSIEKVFPADNHSGIAIAGAAGPALEMVKLFQLQLEHYEKVEGKPLSLEGKANQLGQMLRQNLPAAMQGLAVVPLFGGYDQRREAGRLFQYDITGGRYEERLYAATGSGSLHATTVIKLNYQDDQTREQAIATAANALFEAADEDSATGAPDLIRRIYPVIATITVDGYQRLDGQEVAALFEAVMADRQRLASDEA